MYGESERPSAEEPEWPEHFPPGCPDSDAPAANGSVYHYVWQDAGRDYKSAYELGVYPKGPPCQRTTLSCFIRLIDAIQARPILRGRFP